MSWARVLSAAVCVWSFASVVAHAEGTPARAAWFLAPESRTLARHRYIPPLLQQSAFITSHFGVSMGFTSLVVPGVSTQLGKQDLRANGFTQAFDVGARLYDFVGLYGTAFGTVNAGSSSASAFELGANLEAGFQLGGVVRLLRLEQLGTQLSVRVSGGLATHNEFNVAEFLDVTARDVGNVRPSTALSLLITPARATVFAGSFHLAQTLVESVGLQTAVSLRSTRTTLRPFELAEGRRVDATRDDFTVETSFALSFDAAPFGVPLALMPEYQLVRESLTARRAGVQADLAYRSQRIGGGVYYSGRDNLVLGAGALVSLNLEQDRLEWNAADGSRQRSGSPSQLQAHFIQRYIW